MKEYKVSVTWAGVFLYGEDANEDEGIVYNRQVYVLHANSPEEAKRLVEQNPIVQSTKRSWTVNITVMA